MDFDMPALFQFMRIAAALGVVAAVFFAFKLYRETDKGWYWACLVLSALCFALSQWFFLVSPLVFPHGGEVFPHGREVFPVLSLVRDAIDIAGSVFFAVACYGMYKTMHKIRKRVE